MTSDRYLEPEATRLSAAAPPWPSPADAPPDDLFATSRRPGLTARTFHGGLDPSMSLRYGHRTWLDKRRHAHANRIHRCWKHRRDTCTPPRQTRTSGLD